MRSSELSTVAAVDAVRVLQAQREVEGMEESGEEVSVYARVPHENESNDGAQVRIATHLPTTGATLAVVDNALRSGRA